jgi:hypothetical protein
MFGNMKLLCELYLRSLIQAEIIIQCLESLFDDTNDMNMEIICHILCKLGNHVYQNIEKEINGDPVPKKFLLSKINTDYILENSAQLFKYRNDKNISSRIRFKIQDVMEEYATWEKTFEAKKFMEDSNTKKQGGDIK